MKKTAYATKLRIRKGKWKGRRCFPVAWAMFGLLITVGGLDVPTHLQFSWNLEIE